MHKKLKHIVAKEAILRFRKNYRPNKFKIDKKTFGYIQFRL